MACREILHTEYGIQLDGLADGSGPLDDMVVSDDWHGESTAT